MSDYSLLCKIISKIEGMGDSIRGIKDSERRRKTDDAVQTAYEAIDAIATEAMGQESDE